MGSKNVSRNLFNLRIISIVVVIALIAGAWAGYTVGNSPVTSLMEEKDWLEAEYDSLDLDFQSVISTIETLENEIYELNSQIEFLSEYTQILEDQISNLTSSSSSSSQTTSTRSITIDLIGTCTSVIDGDTFDLSSGKRVRLADIDAPEYYESGYDTSTNALSNWIQGETVYLDIDDIYETDIYGRYVCVVYVKYDSLYWNVNNALLTSEYAVLDDYPNEFDPGDWGTPGILDISEASQDTSSSSSSKGIYVGSINSNKYHLPSCYWAQQINPSNEIWFTSKADAEAHGYVPCKVCKP